MNVKILLGIGLLGLLVLVFIAGVYTGNQKAIADYNTAALELQQEIYDKEEILRRERNEKAELIKQAQESEQARIEKIEVINERTRQAQSRLAQCLRSSTQSEGSQGDYQNSGDSGYIVIDADYYTRVLDKAIRGSKLPEKGNPASIQ